MVYITIPKDYIEGFLYTSFNDWQPIPLQNYDFTMCDYLFFYFDTQSIHYIISLNNFILIEQYKIDVLNGETYNFIEEINNTSDNNIVKIICDDSLKIYENDVIIFEGFCKNNFPHGFGIIIYKNERFEGIFKNGMKFGKGILHIDGKLIYDGNYRNNLYHGKGKFYFKKKLLYEGEFQNGKFHGLGKKYFLGKKVYEGEFQNDNFHGEGTHFIENRAFYQGEFENNNYYGDGIIYDDNGTPSKCEFKNSIQVNY